MNQDSSERDPLPDELLALEAKLAEISPADPGFSSIDMIFEAGRREGMSHADRQVGPRAGKSYQLGRLVAAMAASVLVTALVMTTINNNSRDVSSENDGRSDPRLDSGSELERDSTNVPSDQSSGENAGENESNASGDDESVESRLAANSHSSSMRRGQWNGRTGQLEWIRRLMTHDASLDQQDRSIGPFDDRATGSETRYIDQRRVLLHDVTGI